jgi:phosphotransferase family enzyme
VVGMATPERLPEQQLNELLRRADWRFFLCVAETPWIADMTSGRDSRAIELIAAEGEPPPGEADVAAIGFPSRMALRSALDAVHPGGEIVCLWRVPRLGGGRRAKARMRRAGLVDVRAFWPGPEPHRLPQFWLPLDSPAAAAHLLSSRPAGSLPQRALRVLWRALARAGLLAPICAIGRLPAAEANEDIEPILPPAAAPLLLTGGGRSINKVVALPITDGSDKPEAVVKFARVAAADAALDREAAALRAIEDKHPQLLGVPRLHKEGRRVGRRALVESAVHGTPLIAGLTPDRFEDLAVEVTRWLIELARGGEPQEPDQWWERLVARPLAAFEQNFGPVIPPYLPAKLDAALSGLGPQPLVCEHRDCSPWNVVLNDGKPGLLDWESAEVHGLPGLDLSYFLANSAFILDNALETGRTRESYERLLDPSTIYGAVAARCEREYCEEIGLDRADLVRLRLLAWLIHSHSDFTHLEMESGDRPRHGGTRESTYLDLIEVELARGDGEG